VKAPLPGRTQKPTLACADTSETPYCGTWCVTSLERCQVTGGSATRLPDAARAALNSHTDALFKKRCCY
jgi:hypothetical protein